MVQHLQHLRRNGAKIGTGAIISIGSIWGVFTWLDFDVARYLIAYGASYICLGLLVGLIWMGLRAHSELRPLTRIRVEIKTHRWPLLLCLALITLLHVHEPHTMRVYFDEPAHTLVSLRMHEDRLATLASRAHYQFGSLVFLDNNPSFRAVFFPFLTSLVHDLTGYRPANGFIVNFLASVLLLLLVYGIGYRLHGKWLGVFGMLLLASLPLLAVSVTSAGYDTTNLLFYALFVYAGLRFASNGGGENLNFFVLAGLVFAATRNESLLFLGVIPLTVLFRWISTTKLELTWTAVLSPVFLIYAYAFKVILDNIEALIPEDLQERGVGFFAAEFIPVNLPKVGQYLFGFNTVSSNSLLLTVFGGLGIILFLVLCGSLAVRRTLHKDSERMFLLFTALTGLGLFFLVLAHYWETTDSQAIRLLLPIHLTAIWAVYACVRELRIPDGYLKAAVTLAAAFLFLFTIPTNARSFLTNQGVFANTHRLFYEYVENHDAGETLYVMQSPLSGLMLRLPAIGINRANADPERLLKVLKAGLYEEVVFFETLAHDHRNPGRYLGARQASGVSNRLVREEIGRRQPFLTQFGVLTRLRGIRDEDGEVILIEDYPYERPSFETRREMKEHIRERILP